MLFKSLWAICGSWWLLPSPVLVLSVYSAENCGEKSWLSAYQQCRGLQTKRTWSNILTRGQSTTARQIPKMGGV